MRENLLKAVYHILYQKTKKLYTASKVLVLNLDLHEKSSHPVF